MGRVFVSYAYRDRADGEKLSTLIRSLGHDTADDQDDAQGKAWWNEVVGRIEASEVFVALVSPEYADAHTCRLAAKHAAARGMPVVRVDLDPRAAADCHPVVAGAVGVPFAPEDPEAVVQLAHALIGLPTEGPAPPTPSVVALPQPAAPEHEPRDPPRLATGPAQSSGPELGLALVMVLSAVGLVFIALRIHGGSEPPPGAPAVTASAEPVAGVTPTSGAGGATAASAAALLTEVEGARSPSLPAAACQAGADVVTCTNPAPNISTVVLRPYETPAELYAAYAAQVESLSGAAPDENTGNCTESASEGELGWNLERRHTLDFSIAEQVEGGLDPSTESAGRVFCTDTQQVMTLVWTQDPGLLGTATGQPSELVVAWWREVHLQLACAGAADQAACKA